MKYFKRFYFLILIISILFIIISLSFYSSNNSNVSFSLPDMNKYYISSSGAQFIWPIPGSTSISSYFGKRTSPTAYASSYHKGLDIPATPGTNIYASISGTIVTANFAGSGGCTVTIKNNDTYVSYCHVSPNFLVSIRSTSGARTTCCSSWT